MLAFPSNAKRQKKPEQRFTITSFLTSSRKTISAHKRQQIQTEKSFRTYCWQKERKKSNHRGFWQQRKLSAVFRRKNTRARLRQRKNTTWKYKSQFQQMTAMLWYVKNNIGEGLFIHLFFLLPAAWACQQVSEHTVSLDTFIGMFGKK